LHTIGFIEFADFDSEEGQELLAQYEESQMEEE